MFIAMNKYVPQMALVLYVFLTTMALTQFIKLSPYWRYFLAGWFHFWFWNWLVIIEGTRTISARHLTTIDSVVVTCCNWTKIQNEVMSHAETYSEILLMKCFHQTDKCERPATEGSISHLTRGWSVESDALVQLTLSYWTTSQLMKSNVAV